MNKLTSLLSGLAVLAILVVFVFSFQPGGGQNQIKDGPDCAAEVRGVCVKAAHFIALCCKRNVPLVFLADVAGFMVGQEAEQGGIAKAGAKFITAMSSASVPKFTIITGGAYGAGYLAMCGRAFQPNAMFMWPNGRAAIMGPEQAATTLALVKRQNLKPGETSDAQAEEAFKDPIRRQYETFAAARNFARHLWVDGILDPAETRETLTLLLDLAARVPAEPTRFGVFRM